MISEDLKNEIEDSLEAFCRNPNPLFDISEKLDGIYEEEDDMEFDEKEMLAIKVCVDFTVGTLAAYLEEAL